MSIGYWFRYWTSLSLLAIGRALSGLSIKIVEFGWSVYSGSLEPVHEADDLDEPRLSRFCAECNSHRDMSEDYCIHEMEALMGAHEDYKGEWIN